MRRAFTYLADGEQDRQVLNFRDLHRDVVRLAARLLDTCDPGSRVLLVFPPGTTFVVAFLACLHSGMIAVPAFVPSSRRARKRLEGMAADANPEAVLTDRSVSESIGNRIAFPRPPVVLVAGATFNGEDEDLRPIEVPDDHPALLQYTSGSTAVPKGVVITHGNLLHNQEVIRTAFEHDENTAICTWLPAAHDMGLASILQTVFLGSTCVSMAPMHFLERPARWLRAMCEHGATTSGGPDFSYLHCVKSICDEDMEGLDLEHWRVAYNGSEPVRANTLRRFSERFGRWGFREEAFHPCYGMAEATLMITGGGVGTAPQIAPDASGTPRVGCGTALGQRLAVVDSEGREVEEGVEGEIWLAGPSVGAGYWGRPKQGGGTFDARLASTGEGPFLRTGDLGVLRGEQLFVTSRVKDLIILRGRNYHPHDVEATVEASDPMILCAVAFSLERGEEERLVVVCGTAGRRGTPGVPLDVVRQNLSEAHGVEVHAIVNVAEREIPKTTSGKKQRALCRKRFVEGALTLTSELTSEIEDRTAEAKVAKGWLQVEVARLLGLPPDRVDPTRSLQDLGLDSLLVARLAARIKRHTGSRVPLADLFGSDSLRVLEQGMSLSSNVEARSPFDPGITVARGDSFPMSLPQRSLWILDQRVPGAGNIARLLHLHAPLDRGRLEDAFSAIVERHPLLRMSLEGDAEEPEVFVRPRSRFRLNVVALSERDEDGEAGAIAEEAWRPFDLGQELLVRATLFVPDRGAEYLLVVFHHLAVDHLSILRLLSALDSPPEPDAEVLAEADADRYAAFARWQRERVGSPEAADDRGYWHAILADAPNLRLSPAGRGNREATWRGLVVPLRFSNNTVSALRRVSQTERATLQMTVQAAVHALLHRIASSDETLVAVAADGRADGALDGIAGCFVHPIAVRIDHSTARSFSSLVGETRLATLEALEHQDLPMEATVTDGTPNSQEARIQVLVVWLGSDTSLSAPLTLGISGTGGHIVGCPFDAVDLPGGRTVFDLEFVFVESDDEVQGTVTLSRDRLEEGMAAQVGDYLHRLVAAAATEPDAPMSRLPLLNESERGRVLAWSGSETLGPARGNLIELFEARCTQSPDAVALLHEGRAMSYAQLGETSARIARRMMEEGVEPGQLVVTLMPDNGSLVPFLLGIVRAGCAFACCDPSHPPAHVQAILEELAPALVLFDPECQAGHDLSSVRSASVYSRRFSDGPRPGVESALPTHVPADAALYVAFTSGSTGRPKQITQTHGAFSRFLEWQSRTVGIGPGVRMAKWSPMIYDAAYCEILGALCCGASLCVPDPQVRRDPAALGVWLREVGVDILETVPSFFHELIECLPDGTGAGPTTVMLSGEVLPPDLARRWLSGGASRRLFNLYGPSECVLATCKEVGSDDADGVEVSVGRPIDGRSVTVLDEGGELCPPCVPGDILIRTYDLAIAKGGRGLVPDPLDTDVPTWSTGDVGWWDEVGDLHFVGRKDRQLKIGGVRVEPAQAEAVIVRHDEVRLAAVTAVGEGEARRLAAFVVPADPERAGATDLVSRLRVRLAAGLPGTLLPGHIQLIDALPLTSTGKVDYLALSELEVAVASPQERSPRVTVTPTETLVADLFAELLQVADVSRSDNFFALGGNSLLAIRLCGLLQRRHRLRLSVASLFRTPTVKHLAQHLDREPRIPSDPERLLRELLQRVQELEDFKVEAMLIAPDRNGKESS
jgi:amino acid adenylation domain-containing protein